MREVPTEPFAHAAASVVSKDGTTIGYRRLGNGSPIVLLHGGMQSSRNLMNLGAGLADSFTVIIPDRRGRGLSGPYRADHSINTECEDVHALLVEAGTQDLFGLSAGAVICLWAALTSPAIKNLAIYEPPLPMEDIDPVAWLPDFEREMSRGGLAEAMIAVMRGTVNSRILNLLPSFFLTPFMRFAIEADAKKTKPGDATLKEIIPTMHFDAKAVSDANGCLSRLKDLDIDVLLLGGSKSPGYLKTVLDRLEKVLPRSRRVEFTGLGHLGPDNRGNPELVTQELRQFFKRTAVLPKTNPAS